MPLVDVPELGMVEFPDEMSEDEINQAISGHFSAQQPSRFDAGSMMERPSLSADAQLPEILRQPGIQPWQGEDWTKPTIQPTEFGQRSDLPSIRPPEEGGRIPTPDRPWSERPSMLAQLPETMLGLSEEGRERILEVQKAREATMPQERQQKMAEIEQEYRRRSQMLSDINATDPARASQMGAQLEQWKSDELAKVGIESVGLFGRPRLGEPMTRQMEQDLFGPGLAGKTVGAIQRQAQGLAETLIQPEALPMAPGVGAAEKFLLKRAIRKGAVDAGKMDLMKEMPMTAVGHFTGQAFIPGMVTGAAEQLGQSAGHFWAGDIEAGIETGAGGLTSLGMAAMPIHAARRSFAEAKSRRLETERPVQDQLNEIEESLFQTEASDPARIDLLSKRADLQHRLDIRENWEAQVKDAAEGTGRPITITDESLGPGNIAKPDGKGGIVVNREVLHKLLEIDAGGDPNLVSKVIKSVVNQEVIHASVPSAEAKAYWNSLTDVERGIEESLYPFDRDATAAMKGQEAIRRRIEAANGMVSLEYLVKTSKGPLGAKSLDALERALNATRKVLNRTGKDAEAISEQLEMVRRAENRIKLARKGAKDAIQERGAAEIPVGQPPEAGTQVGAQVRVGEKPAEAQVAEAAQVPLEEAPPVTKPQEAPPAAPPEVAAVAGVAAPAGPAIAEPKPPSAPKSREEIMEGIRRKENAAKQAGAEYVGTFRDKDGTVKDEYDLVVREEGGTRTITVNVPDGAGPETVKRAIAERMQPEEPFAKRPDRMSELLDEFRRSGPEMVGQLRESALWTILKEEHQIEPGGALKIVNEPESPEWGRVMQDKRTGRPVTLELNRAHIASKSQLRWTLEHESAHWYDLTNPAEVTTRLKDSVTPEEWQSIQSEIESKKYDLKEQRDERSARAIHELAIKWRGRNWFERLVGNLMRFASDTIGIKLGRLGAENAAVRAITQAMEAVRETVGKPEYAPITEVPKISPEQMQQLMERVRKRRQEIRSEREPGPAAKRRLVNEEDLKTMPLAEQGELKHNDGIGYGITLPESEVPRLQEKYDQAGAEMKKAFASGDNAKVLASFGQLNFYGGALMGASRGKHPISGANYENYMRQRAQEEAPAAKRPEERAREEEPFEIRQAREIVAQYEAGALSAKEYGKYRRAKDEVTRYDEQAPSARRFRKGRPWKPLTKEQLGLKVGTSWVAPGEPTGKDILGQEVSRAPSEIPTPAGWQPDPNRPGQLPPAQGAPMKAAQMASEPIVFGTRPSRKTAAEGEKAKQLRQQAKEERYKGNTELATKLEGRADAAEAKMTREHTKQIVGLDDFRVWVKNNYGNALGETAIVDAWKGAVWDDLLNATPERIAEFVKAYDLAAKLKIKFDAQGKPINIPEAPGKEEFDLSAEVEGQRAPKTKSKTAQDRRAEAIAKTALAFRKASEAATDPVEKASLLAKAEAASKKMEEIGPRVETGVKRVTEEQKRQEFLQRRRTDIIAEIARRRLAETAPSPSLDRTSVALEDIDFGNRKTVVGAFHKLSDTEIADPATLLTLLTEKATTKKTPIAHTKRLGFFVDQATGEGFLLSVFNDNGTLKAVSPTKWGTTDRPNVEVDAAFLAKYKPIYSVLLGHPVRNFRQKFASEAEFNSAIGTEAAKIEKPARYAFAGEDDVPKTISELEMEEKMAAWAELRGETAREEEGAIVGESGFLETKPGTRVVRGEGGGFQGPSLMEAKLAEGAVPGEMERAYTQPLTTAEVEQLFDFIHRETAHRKTGGALEGEFPDVGRSRWFLAPEDMVMAFEELVRRAHETNQRAAEVARTAGKPTAAKDLKKILSEPYNPPLSRTDRMVISAMQKMAEKITARLPESVEPTPALVLSETLKQIYELIKKSEYKHALGTGYDVDAFTQRALGRFGERPEPPVPEAPPSPTAKELNLSTAPWRRRATVPLAGGLTTKGRVYDPTIPESLAGAPFKEPSRPPLVPDVPWPKGYTPRPSEPAPKGVYPRPQMGPGKYGGPKFTGEPPGGVMRGAPAPLPFESMSEAARRAKESVPEEKVKKGRKKKPEVVPEGQFELGLDLPAAKRRGLQEFQRVNEALLAAVNRHSVKSDIRMIQSGETTMANLQAQEAKSAIVLASMGEEGLKGKKKKERVATGARSAMRLGASRAVLASADPTGMKERKAAEAEREAAINFAYQHGIEPTPEELAKIPSRTEFIKQHNVPKAQPDFNNLNRLMRFCDIGIEKANRMIRSEDKVERETGQRWLDAAMKLRKEVEDARSNWNDPALHETARVANQEMQDQMRKERAIGMSVREFENYVPGMLEGPVDYYGILSFGGMDVQGRNFRAPKKFRSAYQAIAAGPYIPAGYNIAEIMGNRVQRGNHIIARRQWQNALARTKDPVTGDPLLEQPIPYKYETETYDPVTGEVKLDPETGKPMKHEETGWMLTSKQHRTYVMLDPVTGREYDGRSGRRPLVVRKGYEDIIKAMTGDSAVRRYKASRALLYATSWFKHNWLLMLDSFHLGRLGQYAYAASPNWLRKMFGRSAPGFGADYNGGFSAISYRAEDMQRAAKLGLIPQSSVDWANGRITLHLGKGKTMSVSRKELLDNVLIPAGLSPRRSADAFYLGQIRKLPGIGRYNKWLFDRFTPGLLAETAIRNFEAMHAKNPEIPYRRLAKDVAKDVNVIYAQMEPHSLFKDKTARDILQILMLAPAWREGLIQKELRFMARLPAAGEAGLRKMLSALGTGVDPKKNFFLRMTGREGLPPMGALGGMMARGIMTYFAVAQAINLITTWAEDRKAKFTWQNEEGHKLDAKLRMGDQEIWIPTLGVFGELFGDFIRLGETKRNVWERALQIGLNSLGPPGRALNVLLTRETPRGQKLTTAGQVAGEAAKQSVSTPISLTEPLRAIGHVLAPEWVAPGERGMLPMRIFGSAGFKVVRGTDAQVQISRIGRDWAKRRGIPEPAMIFSPTQEASLSKIRHAVRIGDEAGARNAWYELLDRYAATPTSEQDRYLSPEDRVLRSLGQWADRPFTGSAAKEELFRASLSPEEQDIYRQAELERMMEYWSILSLIRTLPPNLAE